MTRTLAMALVATSLLASPAFADSGDGDNIARTYETLRASAEPNPAAVRVQETRANVAAWASARQAWRGNARGEAVAGRPAPAVSVAAPGTAATFGGNGG